MKKEINTLVVCCSEDSQKMKNELEKRSTEVKIKYIVDNYKEALEIINNKQDVDVIIVDSNLECNILEFLKSYKDESNLSKTIIMDNIRLDCYNLDSSKYQIFNIIPKNYKVEELVLSINEISNKKEKYNYQKISTYEKISEMLKNLGIAPDKNGFHYLRKAIYECYLKPELLTSITKEIYPLVSKAFDKKESCIERSMRSAIETGWDRGNYEYSNELFKNCVDFYKSKPTNGEFIAILVDKLLIEEGRTAY